MVPPGVSKNTGKPYSAFCPNKCKTSGFTAPAAPHHAGPAAPQQTSTFSSTFSPAQTFADRISTTSDKIPGLKVSTGPDWDAIAIGKTASLFVAAQLQAGKLIDEIDVQGTIALAEDVVNNTKGN